ncbi:YwmB family TATA-box binding protein [Oceanobacillus halotolerans]|uniref:YwmB family TATA-box binding protein n=1 Tax=Oceanobacillus halotolerans TaxID=2663380 RepID=UPI0013DBD7C4|nr:YwmB family TATA-box binding protein [Oceanobacillus halotolerans]
MKKQLFLFITICFLFIPHLSLAQHPDRDELIDIATYTLAQGLGIDEWEVTIKEHIDREEVKETIDQLKNSYKASRKEDDNSIEYSFRDIRPSNELESFIKLIIPKEQQYKVELVAVVEGNTWNDSIEEDYESTKNNILQQYFTASAKIFSCLTTTKHDIIDSVYFLKEFYSDFQFNEINRQNDSVTGSTYKQIISGHTPRWDNQIMLLEEPMNMELVVKKTHNQQEKITIGTPILINEY